MTGQQMTLDDAMARVLAALPDEWGCRLSLYDRGRWQANAQRHSDSEGPFEWASGASPVEALTALAERLEARFGDGTAVPE